MTALLNTRILASLGMIVFVAAAWAGATGAFFSDTETSTGNTFTAGELDLKIDNSSYGFDWNSPNPTTTPTGVWGPNAANSWQLSDLTGQLFFDFHDLKPGDYGEDTISLHVQNDAWACMAFDLTATPDNGINDPEQDAGDVTDGANGGELQKYMDFVFWYDDGDNVLEVDEQDNIIEELNGAPGSIFTGQWLAIAEGGQTPDLPLEAGTTTYIGKGWCFGELTVTPAPNAENPNGPTVGNTGFTCSGVGNHNDAQTDGIVVDVHFYSEQARNNGQFQCANLPAPEGAGRAVGAVLADYEAPQCDVTVNNQDLPGDNTPDTIAEGIADLEDEEKVVCVADGTYAGPVNIQLEGLTLASLTGAQNTATIDGGVIIDAANVTVTGFKVLPGNTEGTIAGFYLKEAANGATITYNDIDGTSAAAGSRGVINVISTDLPGVKIENNWIHNLVTGIYTNPHTGQWTIRFNDIDNNVAGIGELNNALVVANEFEGNTDEAIGAGPTYDAVSSISNNNFLGDDDVKKYGVWPAIDEGGLAVDAENNFWGPSGGAAQTFGNIDFTPEAGVQFPHNI